MDATLVAPQYLAVLLISARDDRSSFRRCGCFRGQELRVGLAHPLRPQPRRHASRDPFPIHTDGADHEKPNN